jgi:hypothetical protein
MEVLVIVKAVLWPEKSAPGGIAWLGIGDGMEVLASSHRWMQR